MWLPRQRAHLNGSCGYLSTKDLTAKLVRGFWRTGYRNHYCDHVRLPPSLSSHHRDMLNIQRIFSHVLKHLAVWEQHCILPCYTFPLAFDFDHHQRQDTAPKMELLPNSLVQPFSCSENTLSPIFYGSWVAATNKQLLMRIISWHVLKIEKAKYALPEFLCF